MTDHAKDAEAIFLAALDKTTPQGRVAYVEATCAGDPELLRRVRELLSCHEGSQGLLDAPPPGLGGTVDLSEVSEQPGTVIGPYKLLQQIGEGGMGTVYMAEQTRPVRRKVALKVIKPGMDTRQVIARFEAERQALAIMDHVNIARVLDAGATESGRPYFVMELVHGVPITRYCDDNHLTPRQRLELFVSVCQAIQHAHQKGIIHRDIKPSNVMITLYDGKPVPKVIDFGVAKATEQSLTERTLFTQFGTLVGTLEYMSPEQAEMSALGVDTRSDIYSLGVLLYELLTGNTPLTHKRMKEGVYAEILRMIKEEEPPRPSTRLSESGEALASISAQRHMEPARLTKLVRGELDWIVMKALEKDRNRRYETASGFAADLQRHLDDEPVLACPPSASYRLRKFARRNRAGLTTAALLAVALIVGTAVSDWQAVRATRAERRAGDNFRRARDAVDRMSTRAVVDLAEAPGMERFRRALLEDALEFYQGFLAAHGDDPEVKLEAARAAFRVGNIRRLMGQFDRVEEPARQAMGLLEDLIADSPGEPAYWLDLAACHCMVMNAYERLHRKQQAIAEGRAVLAVYERLVAGHPEVAAYRRQLATAHKDLGIRLSTSGQTRFDEAERHYRTALELTARVRADFPHLPEDRFALSELHLWLGNLMKVTSRWVEAERELRTALVLCEGLQAEGPAKPFLKEKLSHIKFHLAELMFRRGRLEEAEPFFRASIADIGPLARDYPDAWDYQSRVSVASHGLAQTLWEMGRMPEAEEALRPALAYHEKWAAEHPGSEHDTMRLAALLSYHGQLLDEAGRLRESADVYRRSIGIYEKLAAGRPDSATLQVELAWWLAICPATPLRDPDRAVVLASKALRIEPSAAIHWRVLGAAQYGRRDWSAAIEALEKAIALDPTEADALLFLAVAHWRRGEPALAHSWYEKAVGVIDDQRRPWDTLVRRFRAEAEALLEVKTVKKAKSRKESATRP